MSWFRKTPKSPRIAVEDRWPKPGGWYAGYALSAIANGRRPGHFVLGASGENVWVSLDPEWDRPFGLV